MLASAETERFLAAGEDIAAVQRKLLLDAIITPNVDTEYGRKCRFAAVTDLQAFRELVPLVNYEQVCCRANRAGRAGSADYRAASRLFQDQRVACGTQARPRHGVLGA